MTVADVKFIESPQPPVPDLPGYDLTADVLPADRRRELTFKARVPNPPEPPPPLVTLGLYDPATGSRVRALVDGDTLDPGQLPPGVAVMAEVAGGSVDTTGSGSPATVGSIGFDLDGG